MDTTLDLPTLRAVIAALPMATLVIDMEDRILAVNRTATNDFAIAPGPAADVRFCDLAMSYQVPRLRAELEAVKNDGTPVLMSDVPVTSNARGSTLQICLTPLGLGGRRQAVLMHVESRDEIDTLRGAHALAVERMHHDYTGTQTSLASDNDALRTANGWLEARDEDMQVQEEELMARCEHLQAANDRLQAEVAMLRALP